MPKRLKNVTIFAHKTLQVEDYVFPTVAIVVWFLFFYGITMCVACCYHYYGKGDYFNFGDCAARQTSSPITENHDIVITNDESKGSSIASSSSTLPINGAQSPIPINYGSSYNNTDFMQSEEIERTYDHLADIEKEKDVFRTKSLLYVSDLARKDRKQLSKKYKLYHWNLIPLSVFYFLPVIQLVIHYQKILNVSGDQDLCYYNFYCIHPLGVISAFNNVFSNIGYILLGFLFLCICYSRDRLHKRLLSKSADIDKYGIPQHFGVFYAAGFALMMEGVLSGCYHVCPNYSNFQFDTAFMYMISWLLLIKIYQTRHPDINPSAALAYAGIAFIILAEVIGVVWGSWFFWVCFLFLHVTITFAVSVQIYYVGRFKIDLGIFQRTILWVRSDLFHCSGPMYMDRLVLMILVNLINGAFSLYGFITQPKDFATFLLAILMVNLIMYFIFYAIMKIRSGEKLTPLAIFCFLLMTFSWGCAGYFFLSSDLTSWQTTPAKSREGNHDCMLLNFYDKHDIWHFLSAMSLFLSFITLLVLDDDLIMTPRNQILVF